MRDRHGNEIRVIARDSVTITFRMANGELLTSSLDAFASAVVDIVERDDVVRFSDSPGLGR